MGERKVLNKYYPPDFDPSKLPRVRVRRPKNHQIKVRMMIPMSVRCNTCGHYIYQGTKFNSRKEEAIGETYLGIKIYRLYFKCTNCSAEITMKTDPQNSDYVVERGARRNFEPYEQVDKKKRGREEKEEEEEEGGMGCDAMKSLENRSLDSKREMDMMVALDEMKSMKSRRATVGVDAMLEALQRSSADKERKLEEEDEALIKSIVFGDKDVDDDDDDYSKRRKLCQEPCSKPTDTLSRGKTSDSGAPNKFVSKSSIVEVFVIKKPPAVTSEGSDKVAAKAEEIKQDGASQVSGGSSGGGSNALQLLCQNYDDSEDED